jgi:lipoprotein-anchoring transpeptidase ErfK/SrfK
MKRYERRKAAGVATLAIVLSAASLLLTACFPFGSGHAAKPAAPAQPPVPLSLAITTPTTNAKNIPISTEIGISLTGGRVTSATLTWAHGSTSRGSLRDDGTSWVPAAPLAYATTYTATVTATNQDASTTQTKTTSFTTMSRPSRYTDTGLYMVQGETYGVAMPVVVAFDPPVALNARTGVQRRLFVASNPPQPGVWHWTGGNQVFYRPPQYWRPGTTIWVRTALAGVPMGDGYYGDVDRSATARVGQKVYLDVTNRTKQMKVFIRDKLARTIPVSLGKPSTPSSSGNLVVMTHEYTTLFDTTREGPGGYRVWVNYAMRLTWGGEFIHAAPWSVGDQGNRNVSHGCVNISWGNAQWLFGVVHVGDPVTVRGTEVNVTDGNGWTAWNLPWAQYIKGSALPVSGALAAGTAPAVPSAAPSTAPPQPPYPPPPAAPPSPAAMPPVPSPAG